MTKEEMLEVLLEEYPSFVTHRVGAIQHLCGIGLSLDQARRIWLYSVQRELQLMEESWNTQPFQSLWNASKEIVDGK